MSSKRSNQHKNARHNKKPKLSSSTSDDTEVFVLPPNLLEKLGIHLGNIESSQERPSGSGKNKEIETIHNGSCHTISEEITQNLLSNSNENGNESSFLETADLMKKSVFLSPTFLPVVNVLPDEAEFTESNKFTDDSHADVEFMLKNVNTLECNPKVNSTEEKDNLTTFIDQEFDKSPIDINSIETRLDLLTNANTQEYEKYSKNDKSAKFSDDFVDEAYSTDGSNSNFESFNSDSILQIKPKQKINIISQEVPDSSQLKEIKNLFKPHKHSFIPVSMDTIITGKKHENSIISNKNSSVGIQNIDVLSHVKPETSLSMELETETLNTKRVDNLYITIMPPNIPADFGVDNFVVLTNPTKSTELSQVEQDNHNLMKDNASEANEYVNVNDSKIIKDVLEMSLENEKLNEKDEQKNTLLYLAAETITNGNESILENITDPLTHDSNISESRPKTDFPLLNHKKKVDYCMDVNINNNINAYETNNCKNKIYVNSPITNDLGTTLDQHTYTDTKDQICGIVNDNMYMENSTIIYPQIMNIASIPPTNEDINDTLLTVIEIEKVVDDNLETYGNNNLSDTDTKDQICSIVNDNMDMKNSTIICPQIMNIAFIPPTNEDINNTLLTVVEIEKGVDDNLETYSNNNLNDADTKDQISNIVNDNMNMKNSTISYPQIMNIASIPPSNEDINNTLLTVVKIENSVDDNLETYGNNNLSETDTKDQISNIVNDNMNMKNSTIIYPQTMNIASIPPTNEDINNTLLTVVEIENSVDDNLETYGNNNLSDTDTKDQICNIVNDNMDMKNSTLIYQQTMNMASIPPTMEDLNNSLLTVVEIEKAVDDNLETYGNNNLNVFPISGAASSDTLSDRNRNNNNLDIPISETLPAISKRYKKLNVPEDKVKEIARYLKQVSQYSVQNKQNSKKLLRSKKGIVNSKLCVQGVEKPGGSNESKIKFNNLRVHKKYERHRIKKPTIFSTLLSVFKTPVSPVISSYENRNVEIDTVINMVNTKMQEFCVCRDFGTLSYYDSEVLYEHLHFWWHTNVNCAMETILDIYNDNEKHFDEEDHKDLTYQENYDNNSESDFNICWHESKCRLDEYVVDGVEVEHIAKCNDYYINNHKENPLEISPDCQNEQHDVNTDSDNNNADNCINSIGDNAGIEMIVEIKDKLNGPLHILSENIEPYADDIKENMSAKTDVKDITISPSARTNVEKSGEAIDVVITNDTEAIIRKTSAEDKIEENVSAIIDVTDVIIDTSTATIAGTSGDASEVKIANDKATSREPNTDDFEQNVSANLNLMDVTAKPSTDNTEDTTDEKFEVIITNDNKVTIRKYNTVENVSTNADVMDVIVKPSDGTTRETSSETAGVNNTSDNKLPTRKRKRNSKRCSMKSPNKKNAKCGVCKLILTDSDWQDHVSNVHCYVAWKEGDTMDFEDPDLLMNLKKELRKKRFIKCTFCDVNFKVLNKFLSHVQKCLISKISPTTNEKSSKKELLSTKSEEQIKCGVCKQLVVYAKWIEHISKEHQYLAWKDGEQPLNFRDEGAMKEHLYNIVQIHGALTCAKCGLHRNYTRTSIKYYLTHIQTCGLNESREDSSNDVEMDDVMTTDHCLIIKCAVCKDDVKSLKWFEHLSKKHDYLAWKDGEDAPDLEDENAVKQHLLNISREAGGLVCAKCGLNRKYPKSYLQHIKHCGVDNSTASVCDDTSNMDISHDVSKELLVEKVPKCAICKEIVDDSAWMDHIAKHHNYIAWKEGEIPLNSTASVCVDTSNMDISNDVLEEKVPKCAICKEIVDNSAWMDHIAKHHNYIAWKEGETPLDLNDTDLIREHLFSIASKVGKLVCAKCGLERKYPKTYLVHIEGCTGRRESTNDFMTSLNCTIKSEADQSVVEGTLNECEVTNVECAVCHEKLPSNMWIKHSQESHNYAAWKTDEPPLDVDNDHVMWDHLKYIIKEFGSINCNNCSRQFKYAKPYYQHVKHCAGVKEEMNDSSSDTKGGFTICGVCEQIMRLNRWMSHIQTTHNYLAWKDGQMPLDLDNAKVVHSHLQALINKSEGLTCYKCGTTHVDVSLYLTHVKTCNSNADYDPAATMSETLELEKKGLYKCAICSDSVPFGKWTRHAMDKHYNVAWVVGDEPVDIKSPYGAAKSLKEYLNYAGSFTCKNCGITRVSGMGFYAHIIVCGKTEEEKEIYQNMCDICNSKYLCIYKSQHMTMHAQQELAKENKLKAEIVREKERERKIDEGAPPAGRRRAAQKAQSVIEDYNKSISEFKYSCQSCTFGTNSKKQLTDHVCPKRFRRMSDAVSLGSSESSDDTINDSDENASADEEQLAKRRKKYDSNSRSPKLPFAVFDNKKYLIQGFNEFSKQLFSSEVLFPQWRICKYKSVPEDQISDYMPRLEESCTLINFIEKRITLKRFEAQKHGDLVMFVGASVQCMSWAPPAAAEERSYLAVATHAGADSPRVGADELVEHAALIQIWDFGYFDKIPELALGVAHNYGTVWAMDWCPSGTRDCLPNTDNKEGLFCRMGLLSVACSNGYGYIFSVPYPSSMRESDKLFHKLKPVAKLKFSMNSDRKIYQASSISWSKEKGHNVVIVGYANGSIAFYDLNTESPFLRTDEDDITVVYPYYDERTHVSCITALSVYPSACDSACGPTGVGVLGAASSSGASTAPGAGAARPRVRIATHTASIHACFAAGWPGLLCAGDDAIMNLSNNDLDYTGYGRRVGFLRASCGCERCGHVAIHAGAYLRVMRTHPVYTDFKRQTIAVIKVKSLEKKRKLVNDDLAIKAEPLTYEDLILRYGLHFSIVERRRRGAGIKSQPHHKHICPDRFPLADVPAMAFCPSERHHTRLAIATYAGFIFIVTV